MKRFKIFFLSFFFSLVLGIKTVSAHCPLCTVGAAFAAGGAAYLGVSRAVIGVFIGAFAVSTGLWFARIIKKKYLEQKPMYVSATLTVVLVLGSYLSTILPLIPLLKDVKPLMVSVMGGYGSLLNRTYMVDYYLITSIIGAIIVLSAPWISAKISALRLGRHLPYQGIVLTFVLLIITGFIFQFFI
ncbi:hypothetical protein HY636_05875 [Candidatus Woesearchaeota archaeon]|nr:hypothetical protein [Candidatus Woesearchaeota archaeon]